jgi:hypothetical protein
MNSYHFGIEHSINYLEDNSAVQQKVEAYSNIMASDKMDVSGLAI